MNVLALISGRYPPEHNGAAKIFHEIASSLVSKKIANITILKFVYYSGAKEYSIDGMHVKPIRVFIRPRGVFLPFGAINVLISFVWYALNNRKNFDVYHGITVTWDVLISLSIASSVSSRTVIESTLLGDVVSDSSNVNPLLFRAKEFIKKILLHRVGCAKVYSEALKNELLSLGYNRIKVIPPSINFDDYSPVSRDDRNLLRKKYSIDTNLFMILFCGTVCYRKGFDILCSSFNEFTEMYPDSLLYVAGPIDPDFSLYVQNKNKIYFTSKKVDCVSDLMKMADVFVLPTRNEGFGLVFAEAMSCCTPVIAGRVDDVTDNLLSDDRGIIVEHDVKDVLNAILSVKEGRSNIDIAKALLYSRENFNSNSIEKKILSMWVDGCSE